MEDVIPGGGSLAVCGIRTLHRYAPILIRINHLWSWFNSRSLSNMCSSLTRMQM
jgi:hypothetical protein